MITADARPSTDRAPADDAATSANTVWPGRRPAIQNTVSASCRWCGRPGDVRCSPAVVLGRQCAADLGAGIAR